MLKTSYSNGWGGCGVRGLMISLRPAPAATNVTFFWIRHALKKGRFFGKENGFKVRSKIQWSGSVLQILWMAKLHKALVFCIWFCASYVDC